MKKTLYGLLALLGFFANAENLFRNGDFEKTQSGKPVMWAYSPRNNNFAKIDSQDAISGKNSLKIVVPEGKEGPFLFNQKRKVKIPANTQIKLSGWFKSENYRTVKGKKAKRGIYTSILFADGSRGYPTLFFRPSYGKWQYKEKMFKYPKEIVKINYVYLMHNNASGTIKYDNVYFGPWRKSDKQTASKPLVLIPEIKKLPRLDGKINDSCWEKAAKISNFIVFNKNKFAKNPTEVYIAYDNKNLY